ncbi:MAG: CHAT domain-containing protein [Rhodothermales bacterium]
MAKRNLLKEISVVAPEAYEVSESVPQASASRKRSAGRDDASDPFLSALTAEHSLTVEKTLVLNRRRDYRKRSAGAQPEDTKVKVSVPAKSEEQAVILVEEDGVYRWVFAKQATTSSRRSTRSSEEKDSYEFEIELAGYTHAPETRRGIGDKIKSFAKKAKAHIIKIKESSNVANLTMKRLEKNVTQCVLNMKLAGGEIDVEAWEPMQSLDTLEIPAGRAPKVLLFIHGTFSSTIGSYGGLCEIPEGRSFLEEAAKAYDLVLGFDHHTLSETPAENAWELLKYLKTAQWSDEFPPVIDAIAYSRGGLVLRSLIEKELPDDDWGATFQRAIFVGATNAGTLLAKPENWYRFIDYYTNLAAASSRVVGFISGAGLAGPIYAGMIRGLGAFAKYLATASVSKAKIPGLSAMEPGGPFVMEINQTQEGQPGPEEIDYFAITSDFDIDAVQDGPAPGIPKRLLLSIGGGIVDQVMNDKPNDLVVDTESMTSVDPHPDGYVKQVRAFGTNGQVYHTVYFTQPATATALYEWLEIPGKIKRGTKADRASHEVLITANERVGYLPIKTKAYKHVVKPAVVQEEQKKARPKLNVSVHWDNIVHAEGDVYAVGHYRGVEPQSAELAVDHHISQVDWGMKWEDRRKKLVLTRLTQQGLLLGDIGQVDLFPWGKNGGRFAAICGMGFFNGDFSEQNLQLLFRKLVWKLNTLPGLTTLCTVLIGSGVGSLDTRRALRGQLNGYADALAAFPDDKDRIHEVKIVEYDKLKAQEILDELLVIAGQDEIALELTVEAKVQSKGTGRVSEEHALSLIIGSMLQSSGMSGNSKRKKLLTAYLEESGIGSLDNKELMSRLENAFAKIEKTVDRATHSVEETRRNSSLDEKVQARSIKAATKERLSEEGLSRIISVRLSSGRDAKTAMPSRLSIRLENDVYRIAGLTASSAIPEREIKVDVKLVHELIERMTDPDAERALRHGKVLYQLLMPGEFEDLLTSSASLVFELDRNTAPIHWEMLVFPNREQAGAVSLTLPISRQLRTTYSNIPSSRAGRARRALVIGNPDGSLEFAEEEALIVSELLVKHDFEVDTFIGSPRDVNNSSGYPAANRLDVLEKLFEGNYAIVHYAGHGDYDKNDPSKTGWLFDTGLLTAGEIQRLIDAPTLIFANACLSGRTSMATAAGAGEEDIDVQSRQLAQPFGEAGLLPSLADEVLKLGVRNYIGTAWEVDDKGAILFAERFYQQFLNGESIGDAIFEARKKVSRHAQYGALWAAYQHYGPPDFKLTS